MPGRGLIALVLLALLVACGAPVVPGSADACAFHRLTSLPLRQAGNLWVVDVQIGGKPVALMLDTGATSVSLMPEAVARLGVRVVDGRYAVGTGSGATVFRRALEIDEMTIGTEKVERLRFPEMDAPHLVDRGFEGLLGMDAFSRHDIEIDIPARTLTLYRGRFCPAGAPPWSGSHASFPSADRGSRNNRPVIPAQLDGTPARALLDTGASITVVDNDLARRVGGGEEPSSGPTSAAVRTVGEISQVQRRRFSDLRVAGLRLNAPTLWMNNLGNNIDMIVGLDVLNRGRIWISNGSSRVYLAWPAPAPAAPPAAAPPAAPPPARR